MGWRGTFRSIAAAARRIEREQQRQARHAERERQRNLREHERATKAFNKQLERDQAKQEVREYEELIQRLLSIHKECGEPIDWESIRDTPPPLAPEKNEVHETAALNALNAFRPRFFDKLFGKQKEKVAALQQKVLRGRQQDEAEYQERYSSFFETHRHWERQVEIASAILDGDLKAYGEAITELSPFEDIHELGSSITLQFHGTKLIEAELKINGEHVIPKEQKKLLQSGKVKMNPIPQRQIYEIYQDYVCGSVFRVARELLVILPVEDVLVNAVADFLNSETGHIEESTVLSVQVTRETVNRLNWEFLDPSDCLKNFNHTMGFKRGEGFHAVDRLPIHIAQWPALPNHNSNRAGK